LPHTFYGWEAREEISSIDLNEPAPNSIRYRGENVLVELTDGSNCAEAADGFCDTPPDYLMERWSCNGNGEYRDSLLDPNSTRFAVPGVNFMSYANDLCQATFTDEQQGAMFTSLASNRNIREQEDDGGNVAADPADMNLLFPENNATTEFSNQVELTWNAVPNADYYLVQVNGNNNFGGAVLNSFFTSDTTFTLTRGIVANRRYFWRVRPVNAFYPSGDFGSQIWRFRTGRNPVSSIDPGLNAAITVAPNPVSGGQELQINGQDLGVGGTLNYELIDPAGRVLTQNQLTVAATGFSERLDTDALAAGVYSLRLRLAGKLVTRRIVVTP
ncbi:MAG: T9SS type A sorting domain-containing protein, partial [Bacteroidota bacterium]